MSLAPSTPMQRRFEHTPSLTVGVEEELMLLDPVSLLPADAIEDVLFRLDDESRFKPELRCAQLELVTPPAASVADVARELAAARRTAVAALDGRVRLAALGTHPTSTRVCAVTPRRRYRELGEELRWLMRSAVPCGLHVHVAVDGAERSLAVFNALRSYLPELAALAANSPYYEGRDTGLASTRLKLTEDQPRSGVPPAFASWRAWEEFVAWGARGGVIRDPSYLWWDLRPNWQHGTVEIRAADAQTLVEDAAAVVAVCQTLVASLVDRHDAGEPLPVHDTQRIDENRWRALRDGLGGELVDLDDGSPVSTRDRLRGLLVELAPYADALGCAHQLAHAATLVTANGAVRQRSVAARLGLDALSAWLADETEASASSYVSVPLQAAGAVVPAAAVGG